MTGQRLATIVDAVTSFPGVRVVDECPWKRVLEIWPARLTSLADASPSRWPAGTMPSRPSTASSPTGSKRSGSPHTGDRAAPALLDVGVLRRDDLREGIERREIEIVAAIVAFDRSCNDRLPLAG